MASSRVADPEELFDVNDAPMLRKRKMVMTMCTAQIIISFAMFANWRRGRALLMLNPFFIAAGVLGYLGAKRCQPLLVMGHFLGSSGLSVLFGFFILAEAFLKRSGTDLLVFAINMPMDLFLLSTSGFSVSLWLALNSYQSRLKDHRRAMREHFARLQAAERGGGAAVAVSAAGGGGCGTAAGPVATRGVLGPGGARRERGGEGAARLVDYDDEPRRNQGLADDLRCPISLEVMRDPVIAADGHSYERHSIERWLAAHATSPLTGRALPHKELVPNHRLRAVIEDLHQDEAVL